MVIGPLKFFGDRELHLQRKLEVSPNASSKGNLGSTIAEQEDELVAHGKARAAEHASFLEKEKEMIDTIDELSRGVVQIKKGGAVTSGTGCTP